MSSPFKPRLEPEERRRRLRQAREELLQKKGWVRLVERADVWVNLYADGDEIHSVYTFRSALELEWIAYARQKAAAKWMARHTHTNRAVAIAPGKGRLPAARGSGHEGETDA